MSFTHRFRLGNGYRADFLMQYAHNGDLNRTGFAGG